MIERIGNAVAWLSIAMVLVTFIVVVLRYGFDTGAIPLQESVVYMHALLFLLGLSYTLKHDAHVRVDLLYSRMTPERQAWVNLIGHVVLLLPMCITIIVMSSGYVAASWAILEGSPEVGGIPAVFVLKTLIPVSAALLGIQAVLEIITCVRVVRNG